MEHVDPNQLSLEAGETGTLIWQSTRAGAFDFACLRPGHFDAGMRGKIAVLEDAGQSRKIAAK